MNSVFLNSRIKLSQGLLFWREAGTGSPIVLLHGPWNDSSEWVSVMEFLSLNFHCFAPDLLGFGESETPEINYSIDIEVETLAEFIHALKLEKVCLAGHSLGGWIAASFALKYPEKVSSLVLIAPDGLGTESPQKPWYKMQRLVKRSPFLFSILKLLRPIMSFFGWHTQVESEWILRQKLLENPTGSQLMYLRRHAEIEAELLENRLFAIDVPALILQGGKDSAEAQAMSQAYAQYLTKGLLRIIPHGENELTSSCAGIVAGEIKDFLTGNW